MNGLLNVNKPAGITSHDAVVRVRRMAKQRKIGHAGTLDPLATGVLILCLGKATRLVEYVMGQPKKYEAVIRLGQTTDSYDADGEIVAEAEVDIQPDQIKAALPEFLGEIWQTPPIYSAIKRGGKPLYKLARQGKAVTVEPRRITIYQAVMTDFQTPHLSLQIRCGTGTYIRSLAHDLGQKLGCGGHLAALRRTAVGEFTVEDGVSLDELTADNLPAALLPPDAAVAHLPAINVTDADVVELSFGRFILRRKEQPMAELVRVYAPNERFIGLVYPAGEHWQPRKIFL